MKLYKTILCTLLCAIMAACSGEKGPLLRGRLPADWCDEDLQVYYSLSGDPLSNTYCPLTADSTGCFVFDADDIPAEGLDVAIGIDLWIYGARLEKGKTLDVYFTREKEGEPYEARFEGDNARLSQFLTTYQQAFDIMKYFAPDPSEAKTTAEYRQILEDENKKVVAAYDLLDGDHRDYYVRLSEGMYTWSKLRIIMDQADEEKKEVNEYEEYRQLTKDIDPNDPINMRTNLTSVWIDVAHTEHSAKEGTPYYIESLQLIDKHITNPAVRDVMVRYVPYTFFNYGDAKCDKAAFWAFYKDFAKGYPQYISEFEALATSKEVKTGDAMPYDPELISPDGTTCKLSELRGTLVYIDFWATWCGPCCKEIPHLEKRVEQFKGKKGIRFVSISMDSDRDAWLAKVKNDNPAWEQYILSDEENRRLSEALQITGIPRFVLLDAEGNIIDQSAPRPSDDAMVELIESNL